MSAKAHRGIGKSDPLDAWRIAAAVLPLQADRQRYLREDDGVRAGLRIVMAARDSVTIERSAAINALTALLRVLDLGIDVRRPLTSKQINEVSKWSTRSEDIAAVLPAPKSAAGQSHH